MNRGDEKSRRLRLFAEASGSLSPLNPANVAQCGGQWLPICRSLPMRISSHNEQPLSFQRAHRPRWAIPRAGSVARRVQKDKRANCNAQADERNLDDAAGKGIA